MLAKDIMTKDVISVAPTTSVRNAALLMLANGVSGLPVIQDNEVCGILTEGDLIRRVGKNWAAKSDDPNSRMGLDSYIQTHGWSVGEAMVPHVVTVAPTTDVGQIGALMVSHKIKRLPVLDDGHLVGIISRCDLLGLIIDAPAEIVAAGDDAIRLAISTRLKTDLGLGSEKVGVSVNNAKVSVVGIVDTELQRRAIRTLVENIRGVNGYVDGTSLQD
jgi:CBS domain-containing protein